MKLNRQPAPESGLKTLPEACAYLGRGHKAVRRMIKAGRLRAVRFSRTSPLLFRESDLRIAIERSLT